MAATAEQIQNCKKIMHEEIGQDDFFDELFDLVMSKKITEDIWRDPEIVAFLQARNLPTDIDFSEFIITPKIKFRLKRLSGVVLNLRLLSVLSGVVLNLRLLSASLKNSYRY